MFCGFQGSVEWLVDWLSATVQLQATGFSDQVTPLYRQAALQAETAQKTGELLHFFPPPTLLLNFRLTLGRGRFCLPKLSACILYSQLSAILNGLILKLLSLNGLILKQSSDYKAAASLMVLSVFH